MDDRAESVRSGRSDRSERSHRSHGSRHHRHHGGGGNRASSRASDRSGYRDQRENRSVTINTPASENDDPMERVEVQILPQDDNWGDNTTAITGNTSETGFSMDEFRSKFGKESFDDNIGIGCARYIGTALAGILSVIGFLSPVAMVVLPKLLSNWQAGECAPECEGLLISFAFKLLILCIATVALFFRQPKATMPRVFLFRAVVLFLVFILTFAFWLFYGVRILKEKKTAYYDIVKFAVSLVDALLFIHYIAVILLEIRQIQPMYVVKVLRSPDAESKCYNIGALSIQRAAAWILEQYHRDFPVYNPYLENITKRPAKMTSLKFYNVDGNNQPQNQQDRPRAIFASQSSRRRDASHNDRFYDELEYERRVRKRKARLMVAAEEAFTHIKRMQDEQGPAIPMDPHEAAQAVFPSMARALQKFLRITRQQPKYSMDNVLNHLALCINYDMSPKAFVERYMPNGAIIMSEKDCRPVTKWVLVCDQLLSREIEHNLTFQLRQNDVSLLCVVKRLPHFNLTEDVIDPKTNKFVLRLNSETSV
ncbi:vang-like protein 2-B [Mytilus edulis]|uniref:Vang-like protein n=2 Tax=Mytilus TaxID=6548 RepID=A0A8B6HGK5_MYTGA|nr:VANGL [Mytilus edulis]VDI79110.1 vang-like [Mytilus galloprovincialis]